MEFFTRGGTPKALAQLFDIDESKGVAHYTIQKFCARCGGRGGSEAWAHTGFTCYACGGSGAPRNVVCNAYTAERLAALNAAKEKADAKKAVKAAAAAEKLQAERAAEAAFRLAAFEQEHVMFLRELRATQGVDSFLDDMIAKLQQYGYLTERQLAAAQNALGRIVAARQSEYVYGVIGERVEMVLTCTKRVDLGRNEFGDSRFLYSCTDGRGNAVVYIGNAACMPHERQTAMIRATLKEFSVYRGTKQTKIGRPTAIEQAQLTA